MRRTIALAAALALLLAGGCDRAERQQPPSAVTTQSHENQGHENQGHENQGDETQLLDDVEELLSGDAQPAGDED